MSSWTCGTRPRVLRVMTDVLVAVMAVALLGTYLVGKAVA